MKGLLFRASKFVQLISDKLRKILSQDFVKSVSMLVGGTALTQALMVLVLPLLTRLYTPENFSVLAVYTSILGIISIAACLRLEIAIPLPESDTEAANLLALSLCISSLVACLFAILILLKSEKIIDLISQPLLLPYLWLLPAGILLSSYYNALQYWATRKHRFGIIARTKVSQSISGVITQITFGIFSPTPFGLIIGQVVSNSAGTYQLLRNFNGNDKSIIAHVNLKNMWQVLKKYDRFPKYSTIEAVANSASVQVPTIIIAALAAGPEAGFLILASKVMLVPMGLIGNAVSQVYLSRAADEYRKETLNKFTANIILGLIKTGVGPILLVGIVSPLLFPTIFGEEWVRAGELVLWMTPWFIMQFLASPISMALHVTLNQPIAMKLQVFGFMFRIGAVLVSAQFTNLWIVETFAVSGFIFYLIYFLVIVKTTKIKIKDFIE